MGCFLLCFYGTCKGRKSRERPHVVVDPSRDQSHGTLETLQLVNPTVTEQQVEEAIETIIRSKDNVEEEKLQNADIRQKVAIELNVKSRTQQEIQSLSVECDKEKEGEEEIKKKEVQNESDSSSVFSYPLNHGCQKSTTRSDSVDDSQDKKLVEEEEEEESSESFFSLSIDSRKRQVSVFEGGEKEVNSPITIKDPSSIQKEPKSIEFNQSARNGDRGKYVGNVLNPIENLSRWKSAKSRKSSSSTPLKCQEKENIISSEQIQNETAVDTSLSSWLVESETSAGNSPKSVGNSPKREDSGRSYGDGLILGELSVEELKELSASTSPRTRRSPPSPDQDEIPIIGTVGSYWSHTRAHLVKQHWGPTLEANTERPRE